MESLVYTYALMKSLYEQGRDYLDAFWPFTIKVFPSLKSLSCIELHAIQRKLLETYDIEIPLHVLKMILNRAKKRGVINKHSGKCYELTSEGLEYLDGFETEKEVERRINALFYDIQTYFISRGIEIDIETIRERIIVFLNDNISALICFINPILKAGESAISCSDEIDSLLISYIDDAESKKPDMYKTFQDMVMGSIISAVLYFKDPAKILEIREKKFKRCEIYLDSNFIFNILGYNLPEINKASRELLDLLKEFKFEIKVFSFTVNEICRVINGYPKAIREYPTFIAVNSIYSTLKRMGWTEINVREFIIDIEEILREKGISIDYKSVDLEVYEPQNIELRDKISIYKPGQVKLSQNHDLCAIEMIQKSRKKTVTKLEDCSAFFLTSDVKLNKFNFNEMGHLKNGTICEVILDSLLTNVLWLKNPNINIPLKLIISAYSKDIFIKKNIWERFRHVINELKDNGKVDEKKVSTLFYHNYIQDILSQFDDNELEKITPEFVMKNIEKAAKQIDNDFWKKDEHYKSLLDENEKKWLNKIQDIKANLRISAQKTAKKIVYTAILIFVLISITIFYILLNKLDDRQIMKLQTLMSCIPSLFGLVISTNLFQLKKRILEYLTSWFYKRKLKEAQINNI